MIITFANQMEKVGKTTLATIFANYLSSESNLKINVFDYDNQRSLYNKWLEGVNEENSELIYKVKTLREEDIFFKDFEEINDLKNSLEINIFDLPNTINKNQIDLLIFSDYIIIPFNYSDECLRKTIVFQNILKLLDSKSERIFIRNNIEDREVYPNQKEMDKIISKYGSLVTKPIYKRNFLENVKIEELPYKIRRSIALQLKDIINIINEKIQITVPNQSGKKVQ